MISLLVGGVVVFCIGLLMVVFGLPIKEFSFGNTMILAGAIVSCTGLLLIGLHFIGRELRNLANRIGEGGAWPAPADAPREQPAVPHSPRNDTLFVRADPAPPSGIVADRAPAPEEPEPVSRDDALSQPPWQSASRTRPLPPVADEPAASDPAERRRRNIMFSSRRREAARAAKDSDAAAETRDAAEPAPRSLGDDFRQRASEAESAFDDAWPQIARSRSEAVSSRPEPSAEPALSEPAPGDRFPPPRRPDTAPVTIVKSGVVDSMAYSLYSDGSIEAQMPEGTVHFASIEELRAHLDQRG